MDFKKLIIKGLESLESRLCMTIQINRTVKHSELSKKARNLGNDMFTKSKHSREVHEKIWDCYNASVALAPNDSEELAFAYGNLSALLLHLCKYEDSIKVIDRTLKIIESTSLRIKLLCRKVECLVALGMPEKHSTWEEAKNWLEKIDEKDDAREALVQIFNKTTIILEKGNAVSSKEEFVTEHLKVRSRKEAEGIFHSVAMSQNEKYGRHLTATGDIQPGELILISKPYVAVANIKKFQAFCSNCVGIIWSGVPCNNCAFSMYCSEECKVEAMQKYHDIECLSLQFVVLGDGLLDYQIQTSMRAVIKGVREFESIEGLRNEMNNIDNCADDDKGFSKDGELHNDCFRSIFSSKNIIVGPSVLDYIVKSCCRAIIALARHTLFFGTNCKFNTIEDIQENEDVIFIGSLLLRIASIVFKKGRKISEQSMACKNGQDQVSCSSSMPCCERGYFLDSIQNFIPHSCNPNVRSVMIDGGKELWYALQPLKKGDPLLDCYKATFFELDKPIRYSIISQVLNRGCECIACEQNWPAVLAPNGRVMTYEDMSHIIINNIPDKNECGKFIILIGENVQYDQTQVNDLIRIMSTAFKNLAQPSDGLCASICILRYVFDKLHGIKLRMPDKCRNIQA